MNYIVIRGLAGVKPGVGGLSRRKTANAKLLRQSTPSQGRDYPISGVKGGRWPESNQDAFGWIST